MHETRRPVFWPGHNTYELEAQILYDLHGLSLGSTTLQITLGAFIGAQSQNFCFGAAVVQNQEEISREYR